MSPVRNINYHDALDETECVSCGAPRRRVVYYRPGTIYWELAEETREGKRPLYSPLQELPDRLDEGLHLRTVSIDNGMCQGCIKLPAEVRFRGVYGWEAVMRRKDGTTYKVPHASEYARSKARNEQESCGVKGSDDAL